jgi:DNA-binding NarL/FixJ family response regulator
MSIRQRIFRILGYSPKPQVSFQADQAIIQSLQKLAAQKQRCSDEVAANLLSLGLVQHQINGEHLEHWRLLSPREQQIAALVCLNYNNRQIGTYLSISPLTVKTHVRNILHKFELRNKKQLRRALDGWDFHNWLKTPP